MKKLSKLFHECAYDIPYVQVGDSVSYAFKEEIIGTEPHQIGVLYIYFQGSNQITDWVRNFLFKKKPYKDMKIPYRVHRGFLAAWKEVEDIIIKKIQEKYIDGSFKWNYIRIIGYSHGGALAGLCHECVWYWRPDLRSYVGLKTYAFEAPRFYGGFRVKKQLRERWADFTVIRTNNDIVTHCPPWILGYTHVGDMLKVKGNTSLIDNKWLPKCIKSHYPQVVYDALIKSEKK